MPKGASYEREIARQLSLWWSDGESDDWFWRSSQSGGRATQRAKSGKTTENAYGDLAAMNRNAQRLFELLTVEIKRGYNSYTISDLIDKPNSNKGFIEFIDQAKRDASLAGVEFWVLIHKRDRRDAVVVSNCCMDGEPSFDFFHPEFDSVYISTLSVFLSRNNKNWFEKRWEERFGKT